MNTDFMVIVKRQVFFHIICILLPDLLRPILLLSVKSHLTQITPLTLGSVQVLPILLPEVTYSTILSTPLQDPYNVGLPVQNGKWKTVSGQPSKILNIFSYTSLRRSPDRTFRPYNRYCPVRPSPHLGALSNWVNHVKIETGREF